LRKDEGPGEPAITWDTDMAISAERTLPASGDE
jgi:hypothetical protein